MAIRLPVHVELQDGSVKDVSQQAQSLFEGLGSTSGEIFSQALQTSIGRAGDVFSNISTAAESMGTGIETSALIGAAGIAGIGIAAVKLGDELYSVGQRFDTIFDDLAWRTGKTGDDLTALEDTIRRVGDTTASSFEHIGDVAGQLSQAFDLAGPGLDDLTHRIATLDERMGTNLNIREFGQLLRGFNIDAADAAQTINDLLSASQRSMIPMNELVSRLQAAGPAARSLGLSMEETANLMLAFEKSGLDASNTTMALSRAAQVFAEHNIDLNTGLDDTITQMKAFIDVNNESAAITLAKDVFGARAARNFVDAVKDGTLTVKSLHDGLGPVGDKLTELDNQTRDWSENWAMLKNNVTDLANEFGGPLFDGINKALGALNDFLAGLKEPPPPLPGAPGDSSPQALGDLLGAPAPLGPLPGQPGFIGPVDTGALPPGGNVGDVLPPLILSNRPPGAPPQDIAGALADKPAGGGAGLGPQVPYPAEYTAGPLPGETSQQYNARMSRIESDHKIAQANADLEAVRNDEKHTAEQLQQAENNLAKATQDRQQLELRLSEQKTKTPGIDVAIPYAPGYGMAEPGETTQQYAARQAVLEAQHKSAEEYAKLRQMESSGVATQNDIINQKNKVLEAQRAQQAAEMRLNDVYTKQVEDATKGMDALGAGLDRDLGLSKGLAGLADNLVRFIGSLAAAPLMGQLNAISAAQGGPGATGSGLIGMLGASGAFGPQYQVGGYDTSGKPYSVAAAMGGGTTTQQQALSAMPAGYAKAVEIAEESSGKPYRYGGAGDALHQFLYDCSGFMSDIYSSLTGQQTGVRRFSTTSDFKSLGFMPGYDKNSLFNIGVNPQPGMSGHMAGTLGGVNVESGGAANMTQYGGTAAGALSPQFSQQWHLPNGMIVNQPMTYDEGGPLLPGITIAQNNTGQPEHVVTPEQVTAISDFGKSMAPNPMAGSPAEKVGTGATQIGGAEPKAQQGASVGGGGGLFGAAVGAGAAAADAFAPGSGAAVQIAGQEIQRAIKAGGQFAGIVAEGLMETFLPTGASEIANDNWITRTAGSFAGMAPQLPNLAGKPPTPIPQQQAPAPPPLLPAAPDQGGTGKGQGPQNVTLNINGVQNVDESAARMLRDTTANTLQTATLGPGQR